MKLPRRDLLKLRWPLLGTMVSIVLAGTLIIWSRAAFLDARQEYDKARQQKDMAQRQLADAENLAAEMLQLGEMFRKIKTTGIVTEDRQQEWAEMLKTFQDAQVLPEFRYTLGEKIALDTRPTHAYEYFSTALHIDALLLHELDLFRLLDQIEAKAGAMTIVRHCHLQLAENIEKEGFLPAQCEIALITISPAGENQ